ncbi:DUF4189 domain-containing protein [uncultured Corynebacterium sp.]|uniref:DUF4189 domain-containing protein n=1 Tax=uncultured Corynebacterium sp. TaxID=159447 RepID=UPI002592BAA0|nr:DUF4189 domain-containing protein [uncultured Corynebacterium sp.]
MKKIRTAVIATALALVAPAATLVSAPAAQADTTQTYVALVESSNGNTVATGYGPTKNAAIHQAANTAQSGNGNGRPTVLAWQQNGCVAYAEGNIRNGYAWGTSKSDVFREARIQAGNGGSVTLWACAGQYYA